MVIELEFRNQKELEDTIEELKAVLAYKEYDLAWLLVDKLDDAIR